MEPSLFSALQSILGKKKGKKEKKKGRGRERVGKARLPFYDSSLNCPC